MRFVAVTRVHLAVRHTSELQEPMAELGLCPSIGSGGEAKTGGRHLSPWELEKPCFTRLAHRVTVRCLKCVRMKDASRCRGGWRQLAAAAANECALSLHSICMESSLALLVSASLIEPSPISVRLAPARSHEKARVRVRYSTTERSHHRCGSYVSRVVQIRWVERVAEQRVRDFLDSNI